MSLEAFRDVLSRQLAVGISLSVKIIGDGGSGGRLVSLNRELHWLRHGDSLKIQIKGNHWEMLPEDW